MFADACEKAMKFTRPVILSTRCVDGTVQSGCGTFFVINRDGWIITAGHVFDQFVKFQEDRKRIEEADRNGTPKDPKWLTNQSFWWGWDGVVLVEAYINREIDIAVGRLNGFKPDMVSEYPIFKDPKSLRPGTSLCRLGFPFTGNTTFFDDRASTFRIRPGVLPMAFFPNEGIHTRNILMGHSKDGNFEKLYVETSSPGIKGQSGGPIFDRKGYIAGMQVLTEHFPLGFAPTVHDSERGDVVENQFLNIGVGVHVKTIMAILDSKGVKYTKEYDDQGFRIID